MPINVSAAIDADTGEIITVARRTAGAYVDGLWVEGSEITFKTIASVQEPGGDTLENLSDGERTRDLIELYSKKRIVAADEVTGTTADEIVYNGARWKVIRAHNWGAYGYTKAVAVRQK